MFINEEPITTEPGPSPVALQQCSYERVPISAGQTACIYGVTEIGRDVSNLIDKDQNLALGSKVIDEETYTHTYLYIHIHTLQQEFPFAVSYTCAFITARSTYRPLFAPISGYRILSNGATAHSGSEPLIIEASRSYSDTVAKHTAQEANRQSLTAECREASRCGQHMQVCGEQ